MSTDLPVCFVPRCLLALWRGFRPALLMIGLVCSAGCATIDRLLQFPDGAQIYGGTRSHIYPDERLLNELYQERDPVLAFFMEPIEAVVWTIDLLGSFVADTACLPVTVPGELLTERRHEMPSEDDRKLGYQHAPDCVLVTGNPIWVCSKAACPLHSHLQRSPRVSRFQER